MSKLSKKDIKAQWDHVEYTWHDRYTRTLKMAVQFLLEARRSMDLAKKLREVPRNAFNSYYEEWEYRMREARSYYKAARDCMADREFLRLEKAMRDTRDRNYLP